MDQASNSISGLMLYATSDGNSPLGTFLRAFARESLVMNTAQFVIFEDVSMSWRLGHQKPRWAHLRRYQMRLVSSQ